MKSVVSNLFSFSRYRSKCVKDLIRNITNVYDFIISYKSARALRVFISDIYLADYFLQSFWRKYLKVFCNHNFLLRDHAQSLYRAAMYSTLYFAIVKRIRAQNWQRFYVKMRICQMRLARYFALSWRKKAHLNFSSITNINV